MKPSGFFIAALICIDAACGAAFAQSMEKVKVVTTFLGLWDTSQPTYCKDRGEFAKAGLDVEIVTTRGGGENVQAVVSGMDIGYSPGTNAVLGAYKRGARIKIISSEFVGQNDSYFYVPADSPIKTIDDIRGKTVAYPRPGSSSEAILLALKAERNIDFKTVSTGAMDATFTMTMTNQVDVGWSVPPSGLDEIEKGKIRALFSGDDVKSLATITARLIIASADFATKRRPVAQKFLEVLDRCIDWSYANPAVSSQKYAAMNKIDAAIAAKGIAFYKREALAFGPISGQDVVIKMAVDNKFLDKPLTRDEMNDLIDILYTTKKK